MVKKIVPKKNKSSKKKSDKSSLEIANLNFLQESLEFNPQSNQIAAANTDWLLMRGSMFRDILQAIKTIIGSDASKEIGRTVGHNFACHLITRKLQPNEVPTIIDLLGNQGGWGKANLNINRKDNSGIITVENCVTARQTHSTAPNCDFLKGYFEGLFEKLFEIELECEETACIAKGDVACVFQFQPLHASKR